MALYEIDEASGIPIWVQLRNRIIYLIDSGHFSVGDKLPTVRALAAELSINYHTVNKVYLSLEQEGYIASKRGKGAFVCKTVDESQEKPATDAVIEECIRRCEELGMKHTDILARMRALLDLEE